MVQGVSNQLEADLVELALAALRTSTGIEGRQLSGTGHADACLELNHRGQSYIYLVECKRYIDRAAQIQRVQHQFASEDRAGILVAPYISRDAAQYCRSIGQQFIDTRGNAFLDAQALYVFVSGERPEGGAIPLRPPKGITNAGALRVTFALLADANLVYTRFKNIAEQAQVSLGTVNNTLDDLERRGYITHKGDATRRKLLEPLRLVDEWAINYPTALRPKQLRYQFAAPPDLWEDQQVRTMGAISWGGEVGACLLSKYLKPGSMALYASPEVLETTVAELVKRFRLRPDPQGNLQVFERFWTPGLEVEPGIAPPVLIYSELLATLDPRATETAAMIKENWIDPSFN